jgi:hypothetical protein
VAQYSALKILDATEMD